MICPSDLINFSAFDQIFLNVDIDTFAISHSSTGTLRTGESLTELDPLENTETLDGLWLNTFFMCVFLAPSDTWENHEPPGTIKLE